MQHSAVRGRLYRGRALSAFYTETAQHWAAVRGAVQTTLRRAILRERKNSGTATAEIAQKGAGISSYQSNRLRG